MEIGQRVVCIRVPTWYAVKPELGKIYIIEKIIENWLEFKGVTDSYEYRHFTEIDNLSETHKEMLNLLFDINLRQTK